MESTFGGGGGGGYHLSLRRRRPLCDAIIAGFEYMLCNRNRAHVTSRPSGATSTATASFVSDEECREAGYVVWAPRSNVDNEDPRLEVLYGGGHEDLFASSRASFPFPGAALRSLLSDPIFLLLKGSLEDAAEGATCFFAPSMRWVRLVLEFLPSPIPPSSVGTDTAPPAVHHSSTTCANASEQGDTTMQPTIVRRSLPKESGGVGMNVRKINSGAGGFVTVRQREVADLWWLTDPPPPKVRAEAFRLRVGMEGVFALPKDSTDTPALVCTIEVCEGRPYAPGRLYRYPNVATSTGNFRSVHSYRVPSTLFGDDERQHSVDRASFADEEQLGTRSGSGVARQPSWEEQGETSITDVKPSHWYNVRHRFSWRKGAGAERPDEVVTGVTHVHTEPVPPPVPPRPRGGLACVFLETGGLRFHFRMHWGGGVGGGGGDGRCSVRPQGSSRQEYILQERCLPSDTLDSNVGNLEAPPTTSKVVHLRGKKKKRSTRSSGGRLDTTSSSRGSPTTTNSAFGESSSFGGHGGVEDDSIDVLKERIRHGSDGKGQWSRWRTVCKSRRPSEKIEMPRDDQAPHAPLLPIVSLQYRVAACHRVGSGRRTMFSEVLEVPRDLLQNLREIEGMRLELGRRWRFDGRASPAAAATTIITTSTTTVTPPRSPGKLGGAEAESGRTDWVLNLRERYSLSEEGEREHFAARVAWELLSTLWRQNSKEVSRNAFEDPRVVAEAESIQRMLHFPISVRAIAGIICEMDATAGA